MLQGTFDIFTLPELLGMLTGGAKTGTLLVERGATTGSVHLREGLCSGVEPARAIVDEAGLTDALAGLFFDLLREVDGQFEFDTADPPASDWLVAVDDALAEADRRIEEWNEVCTLVPSLEVCPQLNGEIAGEAITLSAREWSFAVSLDGRATVRELVDTRQIALLEVCREIAALVERGAVRLNEARATNSPTASTGDLAEAASYAAPALVPVAPYGPGVEDADTDADGAEQPAVVTAGNADDTSVAPSADVAVGETSSATEGDPAELDPAEIDPAAIDPVDASSSVDDDVEAFFDEIAEPATATGRDDSDDLDEVKDRGALLRMFSALREN